MTAVLVGVLFFGDNLYDSSDPESRIRRAEIAEKKRLAEEFVVVRRAVLVDQIEKKAAETTVAPRAEIVGASDDQPPRGRVLRPTEIFPGEGKPFRTVQ